MSETLTEFVHLWGDPAHLGFEVTTSIVQAIIVYPLIRFVVKRWHKTHDRDVHGVQNREGLL